LTITNCSLIFALKKRKKDTDEQLNGVNLEKSEFHGKWNYKIFSQNLA
jgi:hypothetical protein